MTNTEKNRAIARIIKAGHDYDVRNDLAIPVVVKPTQKKHVYKTVTIAAIHAYRGDVLRRCQATGKYEWQAA